MDTDEPEAKTSTAGRWLRACAALVVPAVLWVTLCGGDDPVEAAFATEACAEAEPGAADYCASSQCGPCGEGEGDCDPGQCEDGLACAEEGAVDRCRAASGHSNLQVEVDGVWRGICCVGGVPELSDRDCRWTERDRVLTDETAGRALDCPEGSPKDCECDGSGERMHGWGGGHVDRSIGSRDGGPVYADYTQDTCVVVDEDGELRTAWTSSGCPRLRLE